MSKVLVVGGTGQVGSMVAKRLLQLGDEVYILVRNQESSLQKADDLTKLGANIITGDLTKPDSLRGVAQGINKIICTAAALDDSLTNGYDALIESAENAHVDHILYLSNFPRIQPLLDMFRGKQEIERLILSSKLNFTILKAEPFLGFAVDFMIKMPLQYGYPVGIFVKHEVLASKGKHYWIYEPDVAELLVAMIKNKQASSGIVFRGGGNDPLTFMQIVDRYSELNQVAIATHIHTQAPEGVPQPVYDIVSQLFDYDSDVPDNLAKTFGVTLTHPDDVIKQQT